MISATPRGPQHLCTQCWSDPKIKQAVVLEYVGPTADRDGDIYCCPKCGLEQWCDHTSHEADAWP